MSNNKYSSELNKIGYALIDNIYSIDEIVSITNCIESHKIDDHLINESDKLYAIRQLIEAIPNLKGLIFNEKLLNILNQLFKSDYFLTKAIYFDKPPKSNWFVAYHQDISISVDKKTEIQGYKNWTHKKGIYGVQPPLKILEDTVTIRIHLDNTTKDNGALKVIPKSHLKGLIRKNTKDWNLEGEKICNVKQGGIMLMKPLLLHSSNRTINNKRRRVIHLEFNHNYLPNPINWLEYKTLKS